MTKKIRDLAGKKFGRLTVINFDRRENGRTFWVCKCKCGKIKSIDKIGLLGGRTKSCNCLKGGSNHYNYKGGRSKKKIYYIYHSILARCNNPNEVGYKNYGGRGIKCLWKKYEDFEKDMKYKYTRHVNKHGEHNTFIERINNNGNYCKENCKFATRREQNLNRRSSHLITYNNKTMTVTEWAEKLNINRKSLYYRLNSGWSVKKSFNILSKYAKDKTKI
jgi:hypothetical protein